ncbi:hypothetical protein PSTT_06036 [Puccinia striiformis]|uniref:Uncharacterized protein n=1 Tax=Puccinia striiformis TaxID=27350 RepID=A0A2S4VLM0_9BASI|nr:hypothetical protein PSTT_06036 [Puccinia striiformis]
MMKKQTMMGSSVWVSKKPMIRSMKLKSWNSKNARLKSKTLQMISSSFYRLLWTMVPPMKTSFLDLTPTLNRKLSNHCACGRCSQWRILRSQPQLLRASSALERLVSL